MIAYHFPPLAGSSGIQRTLRFAQYLPRFGWEPLVLTVHPRAYGDTSNDLMDEIPTDTIVRRAFALDTARHLAMGGKYFSAMAQPDRWISWKFAAIREGLRLIREFRPRVLWSTYPIATAHLIGSALARRSGLPWVADFRDPMAQEDYPPDPVTWAAFKRIEEDAMRNARLNVFTSEGAAQLYRERYPDAQASIRVLENGYDEEAFVLAAQTPSIGKPLNPGCVTLLHSGITYPSERGPSRLFAALRHLAASGEIPTGRLRLRFRAPVHEQMIRQMASEFAIDNLVEVLPSLPYREALAEMLRADALLILQAANCNEQIPAKLYEYLRAGRPIVACTDPKGDTARALARFGIDAVAPLDNSDAIVELIKRFLKNPRLGTLARPDAVVSASRLHRTQELAGFLDQVIT